MKRKDLPLARASSVITGRLESLTRQEAETQIKPWAAKPART